MAVIDGKYEILSQQVLGDGQTLFDAVAPDGTALRVIWFELMTAQQETQFEKYRQVLRRLEKRGLAAIFDIVSRPGAHYVAWYVPSNGKVKASEEVEQALSTYGYSLQNADVRLDRGKAVLYGLDFNKPLPDTKVQPPPESEEKQAQRYAVPLTVPRWLSVRWMLSWTLGIVLSVVGVGLWVLGFWRSANDAVVMIPDLRGRQVNEASQQLHDFGLLVTATPAASGQAPGTVLSSEPNAGSLLRPGRTVHLNYALPQGQVALTMVPQLRGATMSNAVQEVLESAKLRLGEVVYVHADVSQGIIMSQTQVANSQISENTPVSVLVSLGPKEKQTFIPNLTGLQLSDAQYFINLAGLPAPTIDRVATSRYPTDTVLEQNIAPNTLVSQRDTALRLLVAGEGSGLSGEGAPSLVGLSLEQAQQLVPTYTFNVQSVSTLNLPKGIISQTPQPGTSTENNTMTVVLNEPPEPIPTPNAYVTIQEPELRRVNYNFYIEAGIREQEAEVVAETLQGDMTILRGRSISGGQSLAATWQTTTPGPITFVLYLNGEEYARQPNP
jgi:eukaryotic-like serine/threonine-protein kinase